MDQALAFRFAQGASAFQHKLARLPDDIDPRRLRQPGAPWPWVAAMSEPLSRQRVVARLFRNRLAAWPPLARLGERAPRLALLDRDALLRHWCVLAIAARPGVLRCCVDREARDALRATLGPALEALAAASAHGRAVSDRAAEWTPLHWACVGHLDWTALLRPEDAALRRMARLSLPPGLLGVRRMRHHAPAQATPAQALALIDEMELEWSC